MLPAQARGSHVGIIQRVFRRIAGCDRQLVPVLVGQQDHGVELEHRRDLVGGRPQQVVESADPGKFAAKAIERRCRAGAGLGGDDLGARCRGQLADDDCDDEEDKQSDRVFGVGDREGVNRWDQEEIEGEHAEYAGE